MSRTVFINGATGFVGRHLILELLRRGHRVKAGARESSLSKLPPGVEPIVADGISAAGYRSALKDCDTFVQLVGVTHPSPAKAAQFRTIDFESCRQAALAAKAARIPHFVYVSVAQPSPVMKAYVAIRQDCEALIRDAELNASVLRPFYILGPGRRWPLLLKPLFALAERLPVTRATARRLTFISIEDVTLALADAIENPPHSFRIWTAADIRNQRTLTQRANAS